MALVSDWFDDFAAKLQVRIPHASWPRANDDGELTEDTLEFWDNFQRALVRIGATERQADEASSIVSTTPDLWPNQCLPLVKAEIQRLQREALAPAPGPAIDGIEAAKLASRDCPDCEGSGMAVRWCHEVIHGRLKTFHGNPVPVGGRISIPCSCPLGKLAARGIGDAAKLPRPAQTVDEYPTLRLRPVPWSDAPDNQFRHRPAEWDVYSGRPMPADIPGRDESFAKYVARLRTALNAPRNDPRTMPSQFPSAASGPASGASGCLAGDVWRPDLPVETDDPILLRELAATAAAKSAAPAPAGDDGPEPEYPGESADFFP